MNRSMSMLQTLCTRQQLILLLLLLLLSFITTYYNLRRLINAFRPLSVTRFYRPDTLASSIHVYTQPPLIADSCANHLFISVWPDKQPLIFMFIIING